MNGIQPLQQQDVLDLGPLQPPDWDDLRAQYAAHFGRSYNVPIKYVLAQQIVGVAQMNVYQDTAWIGQVIVHEDCRGQGIGRSLTESLMHAALYERNLKGLYLVASDIGYQLYRDLGFKNFAVFTTYQREREVYVEENLDVGDPHIRPLDDGEFAAVCALDRQANGESREILLRDHREECEVYSRFKDGDSTIDAFYMPTIGEGLIVARDKVSGQKLLDRHILDNNMVTLPAKNIAAADLLIENGFSISKKSMAMHFGGQKQWQPEMIYNCIGNDVG